MCQRGFLSPARQTWCRGRSYTHKEDLPQAPNTAVLPYGFWQRRFGGDSKVLETQSKLSGEVHDIIGVVSSRLDIAVEERPDINDPFQLDPYRDDAGHYFTVIGRLKPSITVAAANARTQPATRVQANASRRVWVNALMPELALRRRSG
jgi:putative ABC transport system permease protein